MPFELRLKCAQAGQIQRLGDRALQPALNARLERDEAVDEDGLMDTVRLRQPGGQSFDVVRGIRHFERLILLEEALRGSPTHDLCALQRFLDAISGRSPAAKLGRPVAAARSRHAKQRSRRAVVYVGAYAETWKRVGLPCPHSRARRAKTYSLVAVNKRITRYVGVGLYDDLTREPDRGAYISVESGQYFQVFMILERTPPTPS